MPGMNWREVLGDYWAGLLKLPQIFKRIGFRKRNLEDELNEVSLTFGERGDGFFHCQLSFGTYTLTHSHCATGAAAGQPAQGI